MDDDDPVRSLMSGFARSRQHIASPETLAAHPSGCNCVHHKLTRASGTDWLTGYMAKAMGSGPLSDYSFARTPPPGDPVNAFSQASLDARKLSSVVVVPNELLMAAGVIPDTRPKPPPPTWRTRLRWKRDAWRERAARRAYKIIAGDWPGGGEDDW